MSNMVWIIMKIQYERHHKIVCHCNSRYCILVGSLSSLALLGEVLHHGEEVAGNRRGRRTVNMSSSHIVP